ncbi:hypothetical protein ACKUFN_27035, partial [Escherichia coli]|uniref:hypothetical protein n=1 Tax=Escherichia coli TaxID=562 RepID=UPI00390C6E81
EAPAFEVWSLARRECLNPGRQGESTWLLDLRAPTDSAIQWRAGDLLEIVPHQAPARIREWLQRHNLDGQARVAVEGVEQSL